MLHAQCWVAPHPSPHKDQVTLILGFDKQLVKDSLCHKHSPEPQAVPGVKS